MPNFNSCVVEWKLYDNFPKLGCVFPMVIWSENCCPRPPNSDQNSNKMEFSNICLMNFKDNFNSFWKSMNYQKIVDSILNMFEISCLRNGTCPLDALNVLGRDPRTVYFWKIRHVMDPRIRYLVRAGYKLVSPVTRNMIKMVSRRVRVEVILVFISHES